MTNLLFTIDLNLTIDLTETVIFKAYARNPWSLDRG